MDKQKKNIFQPLDEYEVWLEKSIDNDEWVSVSNLKEEIERTKQIARDSLNKKAKINIRINPTDLSHIKMRAAEEGIPYQTLIGSILHKYASGQINI